jgi:hypothetical protein
MIPATSLPLSALQVAPAPSTSARYAFLSTQEVITNLAREGYTPAFAQTSSPRKRDPLFGRHMIDFRREGEQPVDKGCVSRLIFTNSHDGSGSAKLMAGVFRYVCSNGLVSGHSAGAASVRHLGDAAQRADELLTRVRQLAAETTKLAGTIDRWKRVQLSSAMRRDFARMASVLRWGDAGLYEPEELLQARRAEDDRGDLWTIFNRIQENASRGGLQGLTRSGRAATSRPLVEIERNTRFNADLWRVAEEIAEVA